MTDEAGFNLENNGLTVADNVAKGEADAAAFNGADSTLTLDQPPSGTIDGFQPGDTIDLTFLDYEGSFEAVWYAGAGSGVLEIVDTANSDAVVASLDLDGSFSGDLFTLKGDGASGLAIGLATASFVNVGSGDVLGSSVNGQPYSAYQYDFNANQYVGATYYFLNVTGQIYTSYSVSLNPANSLTAEDFYGVTGEPYSSFEYDFTNGDFSGAKYFFTAAAGKPYAGYEVDDNSDGETTRVAVSGVTGAPYTAYEYDYVGGVYVGATFTFTSAPAGATYTSYEIDYNLADQYSGAKFYFGNPAGEPYANEEIDTDANGAATRVFLGGVTGQAYGAIEIDYSAGFYIGYKAFYTYTNKIFSGLEIDVSGTDTITKAVYTGLVGTPYSAMAEDLADGAVTDATYYFTNVTGGNYHAYQVEEDANNTPLKEIFDNNDGSHTIVGLADNQTLTSIGDDTMTGGGSGETFVFVPVYGHDTITDFGTYLNGAGHDTLALLQSEFADLATVLADTQDVGGNAVITAADGDTITLDNVTKAMLTANPGDVEILPMAQAPTLAVQAASGEEGSAIALNITAAQAESDLSAADLTIYITGLEGATLNHGTLDADGAYALRPADLSGLTITPAAGSTGTLGLSATAVDTETASYSSAASAAQTLDVSVTAAQAPATPVFNLAATDQTGSTSAPATQSSVVTLVGQTSPGDTVMLITTGATTLASTTGAFEFDNVALAAGANALTVKAADTQGDTSSYSLTITRQAAASGSNPVLEWNQTVLNAIALDADAPTVASRSLAIESLAVYDAISAINGTPGYLINATAPADASANAAVAEAADQVLDELYPAQAASFDAQLAKDLAAIADGQGKTDGVALGQSVAQQILALRANDGSSANVIDNGSTAVGQWRPTGPGYQSAVTPQWANVTPFALTSSSQFLPGAPPDESSAAYAAAVNETQSLGAADSTTRTADETQIAKFWNDQTGTDTPAGQWNSIATSVAQAQGDSLAQDAQLLAELNVAEADSGIAAFNAKYTYNAWRPITAIQNADEIGNSAITQDPTWQPLLTTPAFPEYVAGHAVFSTAAAQVLDSFFGSNTSFTAGSESLPGVTRSYTSFDQAAAEAGMSRIYGGIHFQFSVDAGATLGQEVGDWTLQAFNRTSDTIPPKITLNQNSGLVTNQDPTITGDVTDNLSGVASLAVSLDGGTAAAVTFDSNGNFSVPVSLPTDGTADGEHTLSFVAVDAAGNATTPLAYTFTLATKAPQITLAASSLQDGGTLASGAAIAGSVSVETGDTLTALSYAFDGAKAMPITFDPTTGAFDQALALGSLGAGSHVLTLTAQDAAGNQTTDTLHISLPSLPPLTITSLTPMMGAGDVGVTYRPEIEFSRAVDPTTLTSSTFYATDSTGATVAATILPFTDDTGAWLLFNNPLPGASTITLHVEGEDIKAQGDGALLDAAGSGTAGSDLSETFTTVSTTGVPGTTISGLVADPGPDNTPMTPDDLQNAPDGVSDFANDVWKLPIAGVKVYILGHEDQAVYTDAQGRFTLSNAPTGDVKVVFDGTTATNPPAGFYFPTMTMDLTNVQPGIDNTVMASMGSAAEQVSNTGNPAVYLPRVANSVLTTLSTTAPTMVAGQPDSDFGSTGVALTPQQLSDLTLTVQPGSLVDANGNPVSNAQVGVSPVPPSIVQDMLPAGLLQHTFDITIQAPGGALFTQPAQLTMPNVFNAAPGTKLDILSFDHTTGRLVIDGTGTVSADGTTVTTDPGSGVTAPGWHGVTPPGSTLGSPLLAAVEGASACALLGGAVTVLAVSGAIDAAALLLHYMSGSGQTVIFSDGSILANEAKSSPEYLNEKNNYLYNTILSTVKSDYHDIGSAPDFTLTLPPWYYDPASLDGFAHRDLANSFGHISTRPQQLLPGTTDSDYDSSVGVSNIKYDPTSGKFSADLKVHIRDYYTFDDLGNTISDIGYACAQNGSAKPFFTILNFDDTIGNLDTASMENSFPSNLSSDDASLADIFNLNDVVGLQLNPDVLSMPNSSGLSVSLSGSGALTLTGVPTQVTSDCYYSVSNQGGVISRGTMKKGEFADRLFLPPDSDLTLSVYNPYQNLIGQIAFSTGASGNSLTLPPIIMSPDADAPGVDGLSTAAAAVLGVNNSVFSNLVPGVSDLSVITSILANNFTSASQTGIVASLPLRGEAQGIALVGLAGGQSRQIGYIATGSYGLAIVDASNFQSPTVLSQIQLSGTATDVGVDSGLQLAAVADGAGGLDIINVADSTSPTLVESVSIDATAVQVFEGIAYANDGSSLDAVDLSTGELLQKLSLSGASITGLARDGSMLYAMDSNKTLSVFDVSTGLLVKEGSINLSVGGGRITAANGVVYVPTNDVFSGGYATVDVSNPTAPKFIASPGNAGIESGAIALNGSGLGVTVGQDGGGSSGVVAVDVVDTSDPTNTGNFITRYKLPIQGEGAAEPYDVAIGDGIAFVAGGTSGLQVVNYLAFDTKGVPPTVTVTQGPTDVDPSTPGIQVVEGSTVSLEADITDDVQVRDVAVLVDGQVVSDSVSYPWDLSATLPTIAASGSDQATIQVQATDTGGNVTTSDPITVQLVHDTTPPQIVNQNLTEGSVHGRTFRSYLFTFSKPIDPSTIVLSDFSLSGPSGEIVAPVSVETRGDDRIIEVTFPVLTPGSWTLSVDAPQIADTSGNVLGATPILTDFTVLNYTAEWTGTSGDWQDGDNWSNLLPPVATDDVLLELSSGEVVSFSQGKAQIAALDIIGSGALDLTGGTLEVDGTFNVAGGTFALQGGTLRNATLETSGGAVTFSNGTLDGVTYQGPLDLTAQNSSLYVANSLTLTGANGKGAGSIDLGNNTYYYSSHLFFDDTQTFDNATITISGYGATLSQYTTYAAYQANGNQAPAETLTLGLNLTIDQTAGIFSLDSEGYYGSGMSAIDNKGTITAAASNGTLYVQPNTFINDGAITVSNGETVYIQSSSFTDAADGTITVGTGSSLVLGNNGGTNKLNNAGTITADHATVTVYETLSSIGTLAITHSTVNLYGSITAEELAPFANQGDTVDLYGTLDNTGSTLTLGTGAPLGQLTLESGGTIKGGTIDDLGSGLLGNGGTLDGVTYQGTLDLSSQTYYSLYIAEGLTATGANGAGPGTINLGSNIYYYYNTLYFDDTQTIDNATIDVGASGGTIAQYTTYAAYQANNNQYPAETLTLGPNLTVDQTGGSLSIASAGYYSSNGQSTVDNKGRIIAASSTGSITINPSNFVNDGAITVSNNETANIQASSFTNAADGTITIAAGSSLVLGTNGGTNTLSNAGTITADHATVTFYEPLSNTGALAITNSTINLYGSITAADLAPFANQGDTIDIYGTLDNTGSTLAVGAGMPLGQLLVESGGTIKGGTIADAGSGVKFSGGTLDGVTYQGMLDLSSQTYYALYIADGLTATGANGAGPGTINLGSNTYYYYNTLYFDDTQTIDNATIDVGASGGTIAQYTTYAAYQANNNQYPAETLTLGPNLTIDQTGGSLSIASAGYYSSNGQSTVDNKGRIIAASSTGSITINPSNFVNDGAITVSNNETANIQASSFTNAADGTITVGTGSSLVLGNNGGTNTLSNAGTITADHATVTVYETLSSIGTLAITHSTVNLYGSVTAAELAPFANQGDTIDLYGTLDNTGSTLTLGSGSPLGELTLESGGTIDGGTIDDLGSGLLGNGGTLDGVTYQGTLDLTAQYSSLYVANGLTLTGSNGTGPGSIDIGNNTYSYGHLYFDDTQTVDKACPSRSGV